MRKAEITMHSDGFRPARPAVNVKIHAGLESVTLPYCTGGYSSAETGGKIVQVFTDPGFTHDWIAQHLGEGEVQGWWNAAAESCFEGAEEDAHEVFGEAIQCWSEGRSGGWMVVEGLPEVEGWDAVAVAKWSRFAKMARAWADDVPFQAVSMIYLNIYEPMLEVREANEAALDVPDAATAVRAAQALAAEV